MGDISKHSPSPLHHTFLLGRARFTAQALSALETSILNARAALRPLSSNDSSRAEMVNQHFFSSGLRLLMFLTVFSSGFAIGKLNKLSIA